MKFTFGNQHQRFPGDLQLSGIFQCQDDALNVYDVFGTSRQHLHRKQMPCPNDGEHQSGYQLTCLRSSHDLSFNS